MVNRLSLWQLSVLAWLAWLLMCLALLGTPRDSNIGLTQIAESWGAIERVALWQDAFNWLIPLYELPPGVIAYTVRASFIVLFALQAIAFLSTLRTRNPSFWKWMAGPVGMHIVMLLMPPSNSDVFFYAMLGDLTANGVNPYVVEFQQFPDHPLLPYQHWIDIGVVYGPLWTDITSVIMRITGNDPVTAIIGFKIFLALVAMALSGLVYLLARRFTGQQSLAVAAAVLVAWQPNMTFESSGQVHNDPVVMLFATAGLALIVLGGIGALRGGIVLLALSSATKFVTLPLLGIATLLRLARPKDGSVDPARVVRRWILDAIAIIAVFLAAFLPYWEGMETIHEMLAEPGRLFAHPVWRIGEALLQLFPSQGPVNVYRSVLRYGMQLLTFSVFAYVTWHFIRVMLTRRSSGALRLAASADTSGDGALPWWSRPLLVAWVIITVTLSMLPVNAHPWYWTWPVIPIALLVTVDIQEKQPKDCAGAVPRWLRWYFIATAIMTLMYHTRIARY